MSISYRFKYSFTLVVLAVFAAGIMDILFSFDIGAVLFSFWFGIPAFPLAWFIAPFVAERIPFK